MAGGHAAETTARTLVATLGGFLAAWRKWERRATSFQRGNNMPFGPMRAGERTARCGRCKNVTIIQTRPDGSIAKGTCKCWRSVRPEKVVLTKLGGGPYENVLQGTGS